MERKTKQQLGAAMVVASVAVLIWGNGYLAANILTTNTTEEETAVISKDLTYAGNIDAELYYNEEGSSYMVLKESDDGQAADQYWESDVLYLGTMGEEEAIQESFLTICREYGVLPDDLGKFKIRVRNNYASIDESEVREHLVWSVEFLPKKQEEFPEVYRYIVTMLDDKTMVDAFLNPLYEEGEPDAAELDEITAIDLAAAAITETFALTQETLDRFSVWGTFYTECPEVSDTRLWCIIFDSANSQDFMKIGNYHVYVDAATGEILKIETAADGKG